MAKKWSEVTASPAYQSLTPDQQEAARNQYFDQVVAPQIGDPSQVSVARQQFDDQTAPGLEIDITGGTVGTAPTEQELQALRGNPTDGVSGLDKFRAGMGKAFVDTGRGVKHLGTDAARYFFESNPVIFGEGGGQMGSRLRESLAQQQATIDEAAKLDAPLMDTGAGLAGNIGGYASTILIPGGVAARGTTAARAALPTTIAGNALQGGALGALQPVETGSTRSGNVAQGAAFGAGGASAVRLIGVAGRGAAGAVRHGRNALAGITPSEAMAGNVLRREAGGNALAGLMTPQPSAVPGVQRTLGQESLNPGVMALENSLRGHQAQVFVPLENQNNLARVTALQGIAGSEAERAAAVQARSNATATLRDRAFAEGEEAAVMGMRAGVSPEQNVASYRSQVQSLIQGQAGRGQVQKALGFILDDLDNAEPSVQGLYRVRKSINDMIEGKAGSERDAARAAVSELIEARGMLDAEIANLAPSFGDYLTAYQRMSVPINRMDVGDELLTRGAGPIPDATTGAPVLTPFKYGNAVRDMDATAARATGFRKAKAADILTQEDLGVISAIQDDLVRQASVSRVVGGGSPTNARQEIGKRVGRLATSAMPHWAGAVVEGIQRSGSQAVQEKLAYLLANPQRARQVLQALEPKQRSAVTLALTAMAAQGSRATSVAAGQN